MSGGWWEEESWQLGETKRYVPGEKRVEELKKGGKKREEGREQREQSGGRWVVGGGERGELSVSPCSSTVIDSGRGQVRGGTIERGRQWEGVTMVGDLRQLSYLTTPSPSTHPPATKKQAGGTHTTEGSSREREGRGGKVEGSWGERGEQGVAGKEQQESVELRS